MSSRTDDRRIQNVNAPKEFRSNGDIEMQVHLETRSAVNNTQIVDVIPRWPEGGIRIGVRLLHPTSAILTVNRHSSNPYEASYFAALACILILEKKLGRFVSVEGSPRKLWGMQFVLAERQGAFERFKTELMKASGIGQIDTVRSLLSQGRASIDGRSLTGHTAICYAAERGHADVSKLLIDAGAEINVRDAEWSIVESALSGGPTVLRTLLDAGLDPNLQNHWGETGLMYASARGDAESARLLLAKGANSGIADETGAAAYDWAARNNQQEILEILRKAAS